MTIEEALKVVALYPEGDGKGTYKAYGFIDGYESRQAEIDGMKKEILQLEQSIDILFTQGLKEQLR